MIVEDGGNNYIPLRWESSKGGENKFPIRNDFSNREYIILDLSNPQEIGLNILIFPFLISFNLFLRNRIWLDLLTLNMLTNLS